MRANQLSLFDANNTYTTHPVHYGSGTAYRIRRNDGMWWNGLTWQVNESRAMQFFDETLQRELERLTNGKDHVG